MQAAEQERLLPRSRSPSPTGPLALRQAEIKAETDAAAARAAAAGPLAQAARDQEVLAEQEKVAVRNAALKDRELDTEVRKPADAERYRVEQQAESMKNSAIAEAEADKQRTIAYAQAKAEEVKLSGESERLRREALARAEQFEGQARGAAEKLRREAIAEATEREGAAEASAILARGEAEATAMRKRAEAFAGYNEAAVIEMLAGVMPSLVAAASDPIGKVDKLTVISTDGASQLAKTVASNLEQGLQMGSDLTGLDLPALLRGLADRSGSGRVVTGQSSTPEGNGTAAGN
jgi:flotillin